MRWIIVILVQTVCCSIYSKQSPKLYGGSINGGYLTIQESTNLLSSWTAKYPNLIVPSFQVGRTHLNNSINMLGITQIPDKNPQNLKKYPGTLLTSLMHGGEADALNMLLATFLQVLSLVHESDQMHYLLQTSVIWFLPYVNVDGAKFAQEVWLKGNGNRVQFTKFRKNRNADGMDCQFESEIGVDLNRNFGFDYGTISSNDPCSKYYPGVAPFSEKQSQTIRTIFQNFRLTLAIDFHCYGNVWLMPYCFEIPKSRKSLYQNRTQTQFYKQVSLSFASLQYPLQPCRKFLKRDEVGIYSDWVRRKNVFAFVIEIGTDFGIEQEILQRERQTALPTVVYLLLRNSYNIKPICSIDFERSKEITLKSHSLVELQMQVEGLLYWMDDGIIKNQSIIKVKALGEVVIGVRPKQTKAILQLKVKTQTDPSQSNPHQTLRTSLYTTQIKFPGGMPTCQKITKISNIPLLIVALMIIVMVIYVIRTNSNKQLPIYDPVQPAQSSEVIE